MGELECWIQRLMFFTADYADGVEAEIFSGCSRGVDVVRPGAAKGKQRVPVLFTCQLQVVLQFAPLVTAKMAVRKIFTFYPY